VASARWRGTSALRPLVRIHVAKSSGTLAFLVERILGIMLVAIDLAIVGFPGRIHHVGLLVADYNFSHPVQRALDLFALGQHVVNLPYARN